MLSQRYVHWLYILAYVRKQCVSLRSAVLLWVVGETQSVIKALYVSLYLHDTRRPSQVARRPVSKKKKKKPRVAPESDWCLTDMFEQPIRAEREG